MKLFSRQSLVNTLLVIVIVVVTVSVMLISFAAKASRYDETANTVPLRIQKSQYQVTAQTVGTVSNVLVQEGQTVTKGEKLVELTNTILDKQITQLQQLASTDASANVQLVDLETQKQAQEIYSPTNGVVATIVGNGEPINTLQTVATVYSDDNVSLEGKFSLAEYDAVQQNSDDLTIKDARLQSVFPVQFEGTHEVVSTQNNPDSDVTLVFALNDSQDASNLLENEQVLLELVPPQQSTKPIDQFVTWYKTHIIGLSANQ